MAKFKMDEGVVGNCLGLAQRIGVVSHIETYEFPTGPVVNYFIIGSDGVEYGYFEDELRSLEN